jgi:hypothetical protein
MRYDQKDWLGRLFLHQDKIFCKLIVRWLGRQMPALKGQVRSPSESAGPTLLNFLDRTGSALNHLAIVCEFFSFMGRNGLYIRLLLKYCIFSFCHSSGSRNPLSTKFFQYETRMYAEYDPISLFDHISCFRVNIQTFQKIAISRV